MRRERSGLTNFLGMLGPGLIFAAAAVGVSHLVQSTRAGAMHGVALAGFIILANVVKYPAFRFGPQYAAATNTSLLQGYRARGMWALGLYALMTLGTMFTVQAAVTMVTAGLLKATLGLSASPAILSAIILAACIGLLAMGRYRWLDVTVKLLVAVLTIATVWATIAVFPHVHWARERWFLLPSEFDLPTLMFLAALVGWMPSAIDVAVWNSLWTLAKGNDEGQAPKMRDTMVDFHVGYIGTAALALCFMLLGAGVMHGSGAVFEKSAGKFAAQVLQLYEHTLGDWSGPLIGVAAFAVMFSTTLAVIDGFPRAIASLGLRFVRDEEPGVNELEDPTGRKLYWGSMGVLAVGAVGVITLLLGSFKLMIDIATTLSFLTAPILAFLNHQAIHGAEVPEDGRPGRFMRSFSIVGIVAMTIIAVGYLVILAAVRMGP